MGRVRETKTKRLRLREMVLTGHLPILWLIDLGGARIWGLLALLMLSGGAGCVGIRETRQLPVRGTVLDEATRRPLPHAVLLVRSVRADGRHVAYRRYDAQDEGRVVAPPVRAWSAHLGFRVTLNPARDWPNEHLYLAPGHAWIRLPIGKDLGNRPPDRVYLSPIGPDVPRMDPDAIGLRSWPGAETWEIHFPRCRAFAQGLREGGGLLVYWDSRRIILAARLRKGDGGVWLEGVPGPGAVRVIERDQWKMLRRVFLDTERCELRIEK